MNKKTSRRVINMLTYSRYAVAVEVLSLTDIQAQMHSRKGSVTPTK